MSEQIVTGSFAFARDNLVDQERDFKPLDVQFIAHISNQIKPLFSQVLMTCDVQCLIGCDKFAIDGVNWYCMVHNTEK